MSKYLDFLVAVDEHLENNPSLGYVMDAMGLLNIAMAAGLVEQDQGAMANVARWTGQCVHQGYIEHGPPNMLDPQPRIPPRSWTDHDLHRYHDFMITAQGRAESDRVRRQRREALTDGALGLIPEGILNAMGQPQQDALRVPLRTLRTSLEAESYPAAIGAAKDLAEAACKVAVVMAGGQAPTNLDLPVLFKHTLAITGIERADAQLALSMSAVLQRLAELRNTVGSGHGRSEQPAVEARQARMAASAATGVLLFLLAAG
jgi:hypothetical protein